LDEEVTLLDLSGESNEPSEFSEVGGVSAVTTSSIGCIAFPADLYPYDSFCVVGGPAVRAIVDWNSAEEEEDMSSLKPACDEAVE
jgi:hypothetical protein